MGSDRPKCPKLPWMIDFHTNDEGVYNSQYKAACAKTHLEYLSNLCVKSQPLDYRGTKFICSVPPSFFAPNIEMLLSSGMNVAKITATDNQKLGEMITRLRTSCDNYSKKIGVVYPLAIALEIKGPTIHTGKLKSGKELYLKEGQPVNLTVDKAYENFVDKDTVYVSFENLPTVVQPGDKVSISQGSVTLSALETVQSIIRCIVERAGVIVDNAPVTIPNVPVELPLLSPADKEILQTAIGEKIDFLMVAGVQSKENLIELRHLLEENSNCINVITEIDNADAVDRLDEIIQHSDGICINCDQLMVDLPKEKVFLVQKAAIAKCRLIGKPVIIMIQINDQTQLLKSEYSDFSSAIIDGVDGLVLPIRACSKNVMKALDNMCREAECAVHYKQIFQEIIDSISCPMEGIYSLAISTVTLALKTNAAAILLTTATGRTAKIISRFYPRCIIIAITRYRRVARSLLVYKGIEPLVFLIPPTNDWKRDLNKKLQFGVTYGKYAGHIRAGDVLVIVTPSRPECALNNTVKIVYASDFDALPKKKK